MNRIHTFLMGLTLGIPIASFGGLPTIILLLSVGLLLVVSAVGFRRKQVPEDKPYQHPADGRFCHICGANGANGEPCDAGLHG